MMTLRAAIHQFTRHLSAERNMAPRTVQAYRYDLLRLAEYLEGNEGKARSIGSVDDYDLKDYLATLKEEHDYKPASLSRVISSIRVLFQYLEEEELVKVNPARRLHSPKKGRKLPVYLTESEAAELIRGGREDNDLMGPRNRTILFLLVMTGIRLSECVGLDVGDVDFERSVVRVLGKGRKERLVPMNSSLSRVLREWLVVRPHGHENSPALFLDRNGNRITPRMVQYAVRKAVKSLGLDPRISPHKLRHTFATSLYAEEVDLRDIQELLGHANISSTSIYTHTNVDKVRAAVDKLRLKGKA